MTGPGEPGTRMAKGCTEAPKLWIITAILRGFRVKVLGFRI